MQYDQQDIPRYKKKKPQVSNAAKHSKHKHEYVKTISVFQHEAPQFNKKWSDNVWTLHCSICGRYKGFFDGDFLFGKSDGLYKSTNGEDVALTVLELAQKYPDTQIYTNADNQYAFPQIRVV